MNQPTIREEYKYEHHILILQTLCGFYDKWCDMVPDYKTHEMAYEALEERYTFYYGKRKYKNYDTFRVTLSKWRANVNQSR